MTRAAQAAWPDRPPVEDEATLDAYLDRIGADEASRRFCRDLARDGVARIDLGDEGRSLADTVAEEMDRSFARHGGAGRIQDAWLRSRAVLRLATLPKVTRLLDLAYGRPAFAFQTLNFRVGTQQPTHADAIHFHSAPERFMCGVWTALEDIAPGSGPLAYRPGSHKLPVLTMRAAGVNRSPPEPEDYGRTYVPALARRLDASGLPETTAVLRKGEALVWAANLAHGGSPITDPGSTRRSLVTHFFFKGCLYHTPLVSDAEDGRYAARLPLNLQTGGVEWPRDAAGRRVGVSPGRLAEAVWKLVTRRPHVT
ncbi:MAG: phytanoyl-CoA dioxygenase family protein [Caulobacteraceae bacterium]|nr:phytanoyl-CoA dioxygenase family protein [Caulobacter sp.]